MISTACLHYLHSGGGGGSTTGYPGGRGGTAGGDGEQSPFSARGGAGSGADIAQFVFSTWSLVPGAGGAGEYNRAGAGSWSRRAGSHTGGGAAGTGHKPSKTSLLNR